MTVADFLRLTKLKFTVFLALVLGMSYVFQRFVLAMPRELFIKPLPLLRSLFILGVLYTKIPFAPSKLQSAIFAYVAFLSIVIYYLVACLIVHKELLYKLKFIIFIIFLGMFVVANTTPIVNPQGHTTYGFPLEYFATGCQEGFEGLCSGVHNGTFLINLFMWALLYLLVIYTVHMIIERE